jgi:hypothetical protein
VVMAALGYPPAGPSGVRKRLKKDLSEFMFERAWGVPMRLAQGAKRDKGGRR